MLEDISRKCRSLMFTTFEGMMFIQLAKPAHEPYINHKAYVPKIASWVFSFAAVIVYQWYFNAPGTHQWREMKSQWLFLKFLFGNRAWSIRRSYFMLFLSRTPVLLRNLLTQMSAGKELEDTMAVYRSNLHSLLHPHSISNVTFLDIVPRQWKWI